MPAKDFYHDTVVQALTKAGWQVSNKQFRLDLPERSLWVDISATRPADNAQILVEVKGFERMPSPVDYLESVVGQYGLYRGILRKYQREHHLYLAIPEQAYDGIFQESIGQIAIREFTIQFVIFNPMLEEIVEWKR